MIYSPRIMRPFIIPLAICFANRIQAFSIYSSKLMPCCSAALSSIGRISAGIVKDGVKGIGSGMTPLFIAG